MTAPDEPLAVTADGYRHRSGDRVEYSYAGCDRPRLATIQVIAPHQVRVTTADGTALHDEDTALASCRPGPRQSLLRNLTAHRPWPGGSAARDADGTTYRPGDGILCQQLGLREPRAGWIHHLYDDLEIPQGRYRGQRYCGIMLDDLRFITMDLAWAGGGGPERDPKLRGMLRHREAGEAPHPMMGP